MLRAPHGFSLIEVAIALVIVGLLMALGLPIFTTWINNTKIRTAAESILNGMQLARSEAVRQNLSVQFVLGGATGAWTVSAISIAGALVVPPIQQRTSEGAGQTTVGTGPPTATSLTLTFNGAGRLLAVNPLDSTPPLTQVDVCSSAGMVAGDMRKMRITVGSAGNVKMCDPQVTVATDPRVCPLPLAASTC